MQEEITSSAEQLVTCLVCNRKFKTITNTHLKRHNMKEEDYLRAYPNASLGKFNWLSEWRNSDKNKQHLILQTKRIYSDDKIIEKRNNNLKIAMAKESYKDNLSKAMKAYAQTPEGKSRFAIKPVITAVMKLSNFERWTIKFGIEVAKEKQLEWQKKNILPSVSRFTKIELAVADLLITLGYDIIPQYIVPRYYCDIYIPILNLIIEVNGDYWHANPLKYSADDVIGHKNMKASQIWEHDAKKIFDLKQMNYNVEILWEYQIKNKSFILLVEDIVRRYKKL